MSRGLAGAADRVVVGSEPELAGAAVEEQYHGHDQKTAKSENRYEP
jgi:hypothetical protein